MPELLQNLMNSSLLNMVVVSYTITSGNPFLQKMLDNIFMADADVDEEKHTPTSEHLDLASTTKKFITHILSCKFIKYYLLK